MPSTPSALALGPAPRGVLDARRWVVARCADLGREDLAECAELGVSELVTNALLHGAAPIEVALAGTRVHPRVEVRDCGPQPPLLPDRDGLRLDTFGGYDLDDGALVTFGRGLSIVARASDAWGADLDERGKVVWFEPAAILAEHDGPEGLISGPPTTAAPGDRTDVEEFHLLDVPVTTFLAFWRHYLELRREVRLLALAHESSYPVARDLSELFGAVEVPLRDGLDSDVVAHAVEHGVAVTDLTVWMARDGAARLEELGELLDLADAFCRSERLLSLARSDEQRHFQAWFLGEFVRQSTGAAPVAWSAGRTGHQQRSSAS